MDVHKLVTLLIEKREDLQVQFSSGEQFGVKLIFDLLELSSTRDADVCELIDIVSQINDEAVYYDIILLEEQLGLERFEPDVTRQLIGTLFSAVADQAFGVFSKNELAVVQQKIQKIDRTVTGLDIVQGFLLHIAKVYLHSNQQKRVALLKSIDKCCTDIDDFPENFLAHRNLEKLLCELTQIDNAIESIWHLEPIEKDHQMLFDILRSTAVSSHNEGKGFSGSLPKYLLNLQNLYLPDICKSSERYAEDKDFFRETYHKKSIINILIIAVCLVLFLPRFAELSYSWHVTDFSGNKDLLVIKNVLVEDGDLMKGDVVWRAGNILKPDLVKLVEVVTDYKAELLPVTVSRGGKLIDLSIPILMSDSRGKRIGITGYKTSMLNKMSVVWFSLFLIYGLILCISSYFPFVGIIEQTLVPVFSVVTFIYMLANIKLIVLGLAGGSPVWGGFMLLFTCWIGYSSYKSIPVFLKWKYSIKG